MIIILFPYRFNNYYFKKYQIKELKKKFKSNIEIHDIFNIISRSWYKGYKTQRSSSAIIFNNIYQWENYFCVQNFSINILSNADTFRSEATV